jgi:hypothetical protein|tara:strand:- start:971 stop:1093 length:123 start_codon:yes stop_codon:yes gene_type:complete
MLRSNWVRKVVQINMVLEAGARKANPVQERAEVVKLFASF